MKKSFILLLAFITLFSCKKETKSEAPVMAKQSEMSALMLQMYAENEKVKQQILKGEDLPNFPEKFLHIHTASLTDPADRNDKFNMFSDAYISSLRTVFESPKDAQKESFNQSINSCIACHQSMCPGPIVRIQKLLIK